MKRRAETRLRGDKEGKLKDVLKQIQEKQLTHYGQV
jgi:hypothetical protein